MAYCYSCGWRIPVDTLTHKKNIYHITKILLWCLHFLTPSQASISAYIDFRDIKHIVSESFCISWNHHFKALIFNPLAFSNLSRSFNIIWSNTQNIIFLYSMLHLRRFVQWARLISFSALGIWAHSRPISGH